MTVAIEYVVTQKLDGQRRRYLDGDGHLVYGLRLAARFDRLEDAALTAIQLELDPFAVIEVAGSRIVNRRIALAIAAEYLEAIADPTQEQR